MVEWLGGIGSDVFSQPVDAVTPDQTASERLSGGRSTYRPYRLELRFLPTPLRYVKDAAFTRLAQASDLLGTSAGVGRVWRRLIAAPTFQAASRAGIVFIHIPKTCGTSISRVLYGRNLPHLTAQFYAENAPSEVRALPSFAVIRDPLERAISAWRFVRGEGSREMAYNLYDRSRLKGLDRFDRFVEFLGDSPLAELPLTFWEQSRFVTDPKGAILVDRLFAFRSADGPPPALQAWIGRPLPHLNASRPFEARLSDRTLDTLQRVYARDFALYRQIEREQDSSSANAFNRSEGYPITTGA